MPTYYIVVVYGSEKGMKILYEDIWVPNWRDYTLDGDMQFQEDYLPIFSNEI